MKKHMLFIGLTLAFSQSYPNDISFKTKPYDILPSEISPLYGKVCESVYSSDPELLKSSISALKAVGMLDQLNLELLAYKPDWTSTPLGNAFGTFKIHQGKNEVKVIKLLLENGAYKIPAVTLKYTLRNTIKEFYKQYPSIQLKNMERICKKS